MSTPVRILIVDDHPAMVEGYKSIFADYGKDVVIETAYNCESAFQKITNKSKQFDLALIDVILPPFPEGKIESGEDLVGLIKQKMPKCKTIVLTSHADGFTLYNLVKAAEPNGVLVKSDFTPDELLRSVDVVLENTSYYSTTVSHSLRTVQAKSLYLDTYNRRIITLLAQGVKTKNMPLHLNLSISAIDKRKAQIKDVFGVPKGSDEDIIDQAKRNGLI